MAARHFLLAAFSLTLVAALAPRTLRAEDLSPPEVENSAQTVVGSINANAVYVRSGPGEGYYPTMKLDKNAEVTVVGSKFDFLKIVPPQGSFSFVPKAYVQAYKDGKVGRVTSAWNVRAGSSVNALKTVVQTKVDEGTDVTILGEQDEYFKIAPPPGAYLYVHKQFVDPVRTVTKSDAAHPGDGSTAAKDPNTQQPPKDPGAADERPVDLAIGRMATPPTTEPDTKPSGPTTRKSDSMAEGSTTQPSSPSAASFEQLEAQFEAASAKPVLEQPIAELTQGYQALSNAEGLNGTTKRIVDARLTALKLRSEAREQFAAVKRSQEQMKQRQQVLQAEREEITEQLKQHEVTIYTAVGTLRTSSLQQGDGTLYRLTDPATARTVVYLRTTDPKYSTMLNQFVGVKGALSTDPRLNLKVIVPTAADPIDPAKVNTSIAAEVIPPSLLARPAQASTDNQ